MLSINPQLIAVILLRAFPITHEWAFNLHFSSIWLIFWHINLEVLLEAFQINVPKYGHISGFATIQRPMVFYGNGMQENRGNGPGLIEGIIVDRVLSHNANPMVTDEVF